MEKLDLTKKYKAYFSAKTKPEVIDVERARFLSILGQGDPSGTDFADHIQALYATAYAVKFLFKAVEKDFTVSKLEGLWWYDEVKYKGYTMGDAAGKIPREEWHYRLLIRIPEYVGSEVVANAIKTAVEKKGIVLAKEVTFFEMEEGKSVQMMHIGPFSTELETLQQMEVMIRENNFLRNGLHHEIYLSDFRKTDPDKLKTILREPVRNG